MIRSKQKDMGVYMIAIAQGALIGIVGFLLMGYLITYLDKLLQFCLLHPIDFRKS